MSAFIVSKNHVLLLAAVHLTAFKHNAYLADNQPGIERVRDLAEILLIENYNIHFPGNNIQCI